MLSFYLFSQNMIYKNDKARNFTIFALKILANIDYTFAEKEELILTYVAWKEYYKYAKSKRLITSHTSIHA